MYIAYDQLHGKAAASLLQDKKEDTLEQGKEQWFSLRNWDLFFLGLKNWRLHMAS